MAEWYPKRRFGDLPDDMAGRFGNREALVFKDERYTFADVRDEIDRAAKALMALGVQSGDHVSLWLNNRPAWLFLMFALAKVGAVHVPVNTRFRTNDLEYVVRQSDSAALITHDVSPGRSTTWTWSARWLRCPSAASWPIRTSPSSNES